MAVDSVALRDAVWLTSGIMQRTLHSRPLNTSILHTTSRQHFCNTPCTIQHVSTTEVERQRHNKHVNHTQDSSFFPRKKEELPLVGFEPTTLCLLGECCTNWATRATPVFRPIKNMSSLPSLSNTPLFSILNTCLQSYQVPGRAIAPFVQTLPERE